MKCFVAPNPIGPQVPIPDGVLGGAGNHLKALLALAQLLLDDLARGNVVAAGKEQFLFHRDDGVTQYPAVRAVFGTHAQLDAAHVLTFAEERPDRPDLRVVVRVDQVHRPKGQHLAPRVTQRLGDGRANALQGTVEAADADEIQRLLEQPIALAARGPHGSLLWRRRCPHPDTQSSPAGLVRRRRGLPGGGGASDFASGKHSNRKCHP